MDKIKQRVLIIDDDDFVRELLADALREKDYEVFEAADGDVGLTQVVKVKPDVVLLDLRMPKMDGLVVLEKLVINKPNMPVIIVSGQGTTDDVVKALRLGAWDYLTKPINDIDLMIYSMNKVLERASLLKQNEDKAEELKQLNQQLEERVKRRTQQLEDTLTNLDKTNTILKQQNLQVIAAISKIVDLHPFIYHGHSKMVAEKSVLVARELGLAESEIQKIMIAGLLIQIGKLSLPEKILNRSFYLLEKNDRKTFFNHAVDGEAILKPFTYLKDSAYLVRCQYEKFNGAGTPDGLRGENIPIGARILKIIQDFYNYKNGVTTGAPIVSNNLIYKKMKLFAGQE